jgi:hypothetical protein
LAKLKEVNKGLWFWQKQNLQLFLQDIGEFVWKKLYAIMPATLCEMDQILLLGFIKRLYHPPLESYLLGKILRKAQA